MSHEEPAEPGSKSPRPLTRRRVLVSVGLGLLVWVVLLAVWQGTFVRLLRIVGVLPPDLRPPFRISAETTGITAPLDAQGWPDYVAAYNLEHSRGVTPETNFVVALRSIVGNRDIPGGSPELFDKALGLPAPVTTPPLYRSDDDVLRALSSDERLRVMNEDVDKAMDQPWTAVDFPAVAQLVDANRAAIQAIAAASRRPHFFQPVVEDRARGSTGPKLIYNSVSYPQQVRYLLKLSLAEANRTDRLLSVEERMQACLVPARVGRLVARPRFLMNVFVQESMYSLTMQGLQAWLSRADLTEADLDRLEVELAALPARTTAADALEAGEKSYLLEIMVHSARERGFGPTDLKEHISTPAMRLCVGYGPLDWDVVLREIQGYYAESARIARVPKRSDQQAEYAALRTKLRRQAAAWEGPIRSVTVPILGNPAANARTLAASAIFMSGNVGGGYSHGMGLARDRLLRAAIAIKRHRLRTGEWPRSLADVSGLDTDGRMDPCVDAGELIYRTTAEGCRVYSVGLNGLDDKGENGSSLPGADDISIRLR